MVLKLVVPLDGSTLAEKALPLAKALALGTGAQVVLVRVVDASPLVDGIAFANQAEALTRASAYIDEMVEALVDSTKPNPLPRSQVSGHARIGAPVETLLDIIHNERTDLVVMTTHARSGLARFMFGSTTIRLVHSLDVPVVVVNPLQTGEIELPSRVILVPLDGTPQSEAVIKPVVSLVRGLSLQITLLSIVAPQPPTYVTGEGAAYVQENRADITAKARQEACDHLTTLQAQLKEQGIEAGVCVEVAGDMVGTIRKTQQECKAVMVAMATHARGRIGEALFGSVADELMHISTTPILLVHRPDLTPSPTASLIHGVLA